MAKKINNEEEVMAPIEGAETSKEEITEVETATVNKDIPEATVSTVKKTVKIRVVEDIDCIIACKPYRISKDKEAVVPVDVAAILCFAKKAYRL